MQRLSCRMAGLGVWVRGRTFSFMKPLSLAEGVQGFGWRVCGYPRSNECVRCKTVKARFWPRRSWKSPKTFWVRVFPLRS